MQTIQEYAEELAAGDKGRWRAATRRAADFIRYRHPTVDLSGRIALTQILLQTTALILYGLAESEGRHPAEVSQLAVNNWAAERMLPLPPQPDGPLSDTQWLDADRRWRRDLDRAVERVRQDLAELLRRAGHTVPDAGLRSLNRYSDDPVTLAWIDLADIDPPESPARYGVIEQFPVPRLALGVTALNDLHDTEDAD